VTLGNGKVRVFKKRERSDEITAIGDKTYIE
jgi:hypothetical protein